MIRKVFLFVFFISYYSDSFAQHNTIDSLLQLLKTANNDTDKCALLFQLTEAEQDENVWPLYNDRLQKLAEQNLNKNLSPYLLNKFKSYFAYAIVNAGTCENDMGNTEYAIKLYQNGLIIYKELNDKEGIAKCFNNLGYSYRNKGDYIKGLEYQYKSLKMQEEIGDKYGMAVSYMNLGFLSNLQGDTTTAINYFNKCLAINKELGGLNEQAAVLGHIGVICLNRKDIDCAMDKYTEALSIYLKTQNKFGEGKSYNNIASVYYKMGEYVKSLEYYKKSYNLFIEIKNKASQVSALNGMCRVYMKQNNKQEALKYALIAYQQSKEMGYPDELENSSYRLYDVYKSMGMYSKALEMHELYLQMRDSVVNEKTKTANTRSTIRYEYQKKAIADSVRVEEEKKIVNAQLQNEKTQRIALYGGLILTLFFALFMYNRFAVTRKQNAIIESQKKIVESQKHIVEEKQKEIIDSITYARRIQQSLLPTISYIERTLNELKNNTKTDA